MDQTAKSPFGEQAKFLMVNIDDGATEGSTQQFMEKNGVTASVVAMGKTPDFFRQNHIPHKALVNAEGKLVANYRFREVGGASGDRVGIEPDFALLA
mmetsp:Transcript_114748/g.319626  ORF Transcript_114748/g.319626 Transcript_114748/m.319626 type:complete len:97 (-) Transcript_114748:102-392(-)|eukprot:CAMPEP_0179136834 /NCGR_PEP_ID=MMETSP0796-20121207/65231_1 /TAXON_ID=73915 /ORGANISM="Pyrodinium bahamense, Strain pbaha01" /LENGTH=96 /DNA_ID=CAMNT_0020835951 /DNA_START=230 /DNA_END=520 /DNA_ORIENTATION=+